MGIFDPWAGFGITFRTMFRRTETQAYPYKGAKKITQARYHGRHQLNRWPDGLEKCVGCELCAWACPADAIYVEGAANTDEERYSPGERYGRVYQINYLRCILCGMCIEACPTRALTMTNVFDFADTTRESMIYDKERLLAPLLPGMEEPPHPRRLGNDEKDYFLGLPEDGVPDTRVRTGDETGGEGGAVARPGKRGRVVRKGKARDAARGSKDAATSEQTASTGEAGAATSDEDEGVTR